MMIDRFIYKCFAALDSFSNFLFGWMEPKYCQCNINTGSKRKCKRCGCQRKKLG